MKIVYRVVPSVGLALLVVGLLVVSVSAAEEKGGPKQQAGHFEKEITVTARFDYLLFLPAGYEKQETWPLIVFLHGMGERGSDLELVKTHGPPKIVEEKKDFPFIVLSPQCPGNDRWNPRYLIELVDEVANKYNVDKQRIYLTGLSMGGYGTWSLAIEYPRVFAAIVPICGGGDPGMVERIKDLPIWVFHGGKDTTVPLWRAKAMVEALKKVGGNVKLTVYPEAGHDSWTQTYDNPELYEWLLKHRRAE